MGGCNFGKILPINVPKCHGVKVHVFCQKLSKSSQFFYLEPGLYRFITEIVEAMNTLFQERHNHSESCITVKVSRRTQKNEIHLANERSALAFFSSDLEHIFGCNDSNEFGWSNVERKRTSQTTICSRLCPHAPSHDIHRLN